MCQARIAAMASEEALQIFTQLLKEGYFGKAVAAIEEYVKENPGDYQTTFLLLETWLDKLGNARLAEELVRSILRSPAFSQEQKDSFSRRLRDWQRESYSGRIMPARIVLRMSEE